ncbi:MAG: hypothetical protein NZ960_00435 [Candidatus Kapabacteria bacterium]|nr:hypothetical protein [Candidatus Kapabacteria bacterium]MDW8011494.1 hypothetical protein [Bacteroidota bacterium]
MKLSPDTEAVIEYLQAYSGNTLRKMRDVGSILELAAQRGDAGIANDIIFTGAALWRTYRVWKRLGPSDEGYKTVSEAFSESITKLRYLLHQLLEGAPAPLVGRFQEVYLRLTEGAVRNLVDLSHDLSWLKQLQSDMRRGDRQS